MVRTIGCGEAASATAVARFAAAVRGLPGPRDFAGFSSWLVEGCRLAQPLEPLMGSRIAPPHAPPTGKLVSAEGRLDVAGTPVLIGAPALVGGDLLVEPICD
jgi:hypothetical protein